MVEIISYHKHKKNISSNSNQSKLPDPETADELVAWLDTETSLIDPSHLSVSEDDVLSDPVFSDVEAAVALLRLEADDEQTLPDQWDEEARDSTSLSWRSLNTNKYELKVNYL